MIPFPPLVGVGTTLGRRERGPLLGVRASLLGLIFWVVGWLTTDTLACRFTGEWNRPLGFCSSSDSWCCRGSGCFEVFFEKVVLSKK